MAEGREPERLSRRGVVRVDAGPFRQVKLELGVVLLVCLGVVLFTVGWPGDPRLELLAVAGVAVAGAAWLGWRTRRTLARLRRGRRP